MSRPGIGAMLGILGGNENTVKAMQAAMNLPIEYIAVKDDSLRIVLEKGTLCLYDDAQSCCEHRYMVCDDDLGAFVGATLLGAEIVNAPDETDEYGEHEVQFLKVNTSAGTFTIANHNEHNGYYGGFWIVATWTNKKELP